MVSSHPLVLGARADNPRHHVRPVAPAPGPGSQEHHRPPGSAGRAPQPVHSPVPGRDRSARRLPEPDGHRAPQRDLLPGVDGGESSLTQHLSQTDTGHRRCNVPRSTGNREGTAHGHMIVASVHRRKPIGYWSVSPRPLAVGSRRRSKKYQNRTWAPVVRFSRSRQPGYVLAMLRIWT